MAVARPNVLYWLWFALGGRLPMRYREWVLHDATSSTWLLRFALRALVRMAPLVLGALVVPWLTGAHLGLALAAVALGLIVGMYYSLSYALERTEQKLVSYGYPPRTGEQIRQEKAEAKNPGKLERYERAWRQNPDAPNPTPSIRQPNKGIPATEPTPGT